jgi:hypothetical protein
MRRREMNDQVIYPEQLSSRYSQSAVTSWHVFTKVAVPGICEG